jgi:hypothetical protein
MAYVQFTREEFEDWLATTGHRWKLKPGTAGIYVTPLSDTVAVEVSSSMTGKGNVVTYAGASMGARLVSQVTGFTLNKVAQGQDHVKRTTNWRVNLGKVIDRIIDAYRKSSAFYDALAAIEDRAAYKKDTMAKIEAIPGWEQDQFLKSLHDRLESNGILTQKQLEALERAGHARPGPQEPNVNPRLLGQVRALYAVGKERSNPWLMDFAKSMGEIIKAGRPGTEAQKRTLNGLLDEHEDAISDILRRSPNLIRVSAERVADRHLRRDS